MNISVLGKFSIEYNGKVVSDNLNRSRKMWNLLAFIIMNHNSAITQSRFIDALLSDDNNNPINALKTQLFRTREMLRPLELEGDGCIISSRGAYSWNPEYHIVLDAEVFETLIQEAENEELSNKHRINMYLEALRLYDGDFIPKLSGEVWTIPISARYHGIYLDAVKKLCDILEEENDPETIINVILKALEIDNLDETLHCLLIMAYIRCDRYRDALDHYDSATSILYRNLGVNPSDELRALYSQIMDTQKSLETDLAIIQEQLMENSLEEGAFFCEYGYFVKNYQLTKRRLERLGLSTYLCLVTLQTERGKTPDLVKLNIYMAKLLNILKLSLRTGDVVAQYSGAQYILMLPCVNFENAEMVMKRILANYKKKFRNDKILLNYKIKEI
ncbi:MAG: BTAD domain-containing putative transcriptional regulator [Catonella sp.]|uniref:AfsR/SARP family transcriptional regulator n=1 Tax=Catonella sp. TaxID=2382125 RepID=UPI003FA11F8F